MSGALSFVAPSSANALAQDSPVTPAQMFRVDTCVAKDRHTIWTKPVSGKIGA